jgi:hypothetical protein
MKAGMQSVNGNEAGFVRRLKDLISAFFPCLKRCHHPAGKIFNHLLHRVLSG